MTLAIDLTCIALAAQVNLLFRQSLDEKTEELESYTDSFTKLQQKVAEQRDTINQMNSTMTKNELQLVRKNNETEELTEKTNALQNNLDSVFRELRECQQQLADKEAKFAQSQAVVNEEILQVGVIVYHRRDIRINFLC